MKTTDKNKKNSNSTSIGKLAVMAGATFAATTGMVAQADDINAVTPESNSPVAESEQVTQGQVEEAIRYADKTQEAVDQQGKVVDQAQQDLTDAQKEVEHSKVALDAAETNAGQTTPEDIESLSKNLESQEAQLTVAKAELERKQTEFQAKETETRSQTAIVKKKEEEEVAVQAEINQAKGKLAQSEEPVREDEIAKAEKKKQAADERVTKAQAAVAQAQRDVKEAKANDQKNQEYLETVTKARNTALDQVKQAQTAVDKDAKSSTAYQTVNHIQVDAAYVKSLKAYAQSRGSNGNFNASSLLVRNKYIVEKGDNRQVGNWSSLSQEVKEELNSFALSLVNEVRQSFGYKSAVLTQGMIQFSTDVASNYERKNKAGFHHHETDSIQAAAEKNGLKTTSKASNLGYEDLNMYPYNVSTVGGLKNAIYGSLTSLLFNDKALSGSWDHAVSLAGLTNLRWTGVDYPVDQTYLGVSISTVGGSSSIHFMKVEGSNNIQNQKFNKTLVKASTKAGVNQALVTKLQQAKTTLANAETTLKAARAVQSKSPQAQKVLQSALLDLQIGLNDLKAAQYDVEQARASVAQQRTLRATNQKEARSALENAQKRLTSLHEEVLSQNKVLQDLKSQLSQAQTNYNEANSAYQTTVRSIALLKAEIANAENSPVLLEMARKRAKDAEVDLSVKKAALIVQQLHLDELTAKNESAQAEKARLVAAFKAVIPAVTTPNHTSDSKKSDTVANFVKPVETTSETRQTEQPIAEQTPSFSTEGFEGQDVVSLQADQQTEKNTQVLSVNLELDRALIPAPSRSSASAFQEEDGNEVLVSSTHQDDRQIAETSSDIVMKESSSEQVATPKETTQEDSSQEQPTDQAGLLASGVIAGATILGLAGLAVNKKKGDDL
ncbi:SEC10/PgrA surface exclusion domain-containing protein [Streptococcus sp. DD13]|uniref:SEC10/PgrA surface exclusion domain-containing protein n=1 Tax=Streptococcus sp. DD13 TaxID=1777881 RepID=UPI0007969B7A|nr:SEC10/PgrA surface exclusion domain-containing protein [Streptococcus sp. DD13]KXT78941.1 Surface exclusion protein Sea1/PrgA [Streptococcus sp. DD13]